METKKYKVVEAFELEGKSYEQDQEVELTEAQATELGTKVSEIVPATPPAGDPPEGENPPAA